MSPIYSGGAFDASGSLPTAGDDQRTARAFIGLLNTIVGDDQTYIGYDGNPSNPTGTFTITTPDGSVAILGQPVSNRQTALGTSASTAATAGLSLPMLLLIAGLAYLALK